MRKILNTLSRRLAREYAVQAIYSWQISKNDINEVKYPFLMKKNKNVDIDYFEKILDGIFFHKEYLDSIMKNYLLDHTKTLGEIEKAILLLTVFELSKSDIPYKVVINEGIELAKSFCSQGSYKFINGVLDTLGPHIRPNKK